MNKNEKTLHAYRILWNLLTRAEQEALLKHAEMKLELTNGSLEEDVREILNEDIDNIRDVCGRLFYSLDQNGNKVFDDSEIEKY